METVKELLKENKLNDALALLLKYIKKKPKDTEIIFHLGKVYFYLNDYSNAKKFFQKILNIKQKQPNDNLFLWSKYFMAHILKLNEPQKAIDILISIKQLNPKDINEEINFLLYEIIKLIQNYNFCANYKKAIELYKKYSKYVLNKDKFLSNKFLNEYEISTKQTVLKSKPRNMLVILSNICNIKCIMCGQRHEEKAVLNNKFINFIKKNSQYLEKIIWQGGEPFLFKNFKDLLMYFSNNKHLKQIVITNFLLLNENILEFIIKNKIFVIASIDGATKQTYEKIRRGASFNKIVSNLKTYNRLSKKYNVTEKLLQINFVVMKENYNEIIKIIEFAHKYNISKVAFIKCVHYEEKKDFSKEELFYIKNTLLPAAYEKARKNGIDIDNQIDSLFEQILPVKLNKNKKIKKNKNLYCHLSWQELIVSYENIIKTDVLCLMHEKYEPKNINSLNAIWNSKMMISLRKHIVAGNLNGCNSTCMYIDKKYLKPAF